MNSVRALPFEAWPSSHREAFLRATDHRMPRETALAKNWEEPTRRTVKFAWGLWLDHCLRHARVIECTPAETISAPGLEGFIRELTGRVRYSTASTYVRDVGQALRIMQGDCGLPLRLVRHAAIDLARASSSLGDDIISKVGASDVYESAIGRMDQTRNGSLNSWRIALDYMDALMLVLDLMSNARLRTLSLTTRDHFDLKEDFYRLVYREDEVKTRKKLLRSLPSELSPYIAHGFEVAKWLAKSGGQERVNGLWLTRRGKRMSPGWLSKRMRRASLKLVKVPLTPQRIRRLAATSIHALAPRQTAVATSVLQHYGPDETGGYVKTGGAGFAFEYYRLMQAKFRNSEP